MQSANASQRLRNATRDIHAAVERTPIVQLLMSQNLSAYDYLYVLSAWLKVWDPLESLVKRNCPAGLTKEQTPRVRTRLLRQDIRGICKEIGEYPCFVSAGAENLKTIKLLMGLASNRPSWLGIAYVMQGSMLGGAVVASHLQRTLPNSVVNHTRFFCPHGTMDLGTDFRRWLQCLDNELANSSEQEQAMSSAIFTFEYLVSSWSASAKNC